MASEVEPIGPVAAMAGEYSSRFEQCNESVRSCFSQLAELIAPTISLDLHHQRSSILLGTNV